MLYCFFFFFLIRVRVRFLEKVRIDHQTRLGLGLGIREVRVRADTPMTYNSQVIPGCTQTSSIPFLHFQCFGSVEDERASKTQLCNK